MVAVSLITSNRAEESGLLRLIGGGGHSLVVAEAAQLAGFQLQGFFDDNPASPLRALCTHLGPIEDAFHTPCNIATIVAAGDLNLRASIQRQYRGPLATVVHPSAVISPSAVITEGSYVAAGAIVNAGTMVGTHAIINTRAVVEHDCRLGKNVHLGPGAILGGGVRVGQCTLVGIHASVKPNITIGAYCVIGVGAVVVHDVAHYATAVGVPARSAQQSHLLTKRTIA